MPLVFNVNPRVAQLIDANLDRAREGLRVIEEWSRYGNNPKDLVITLKDWRHQLGKHHIEIYKKARNISKDQGIGLSHPAQRNRDKPSEIIAFANRMCPSSKTSSSGLTPQSRAISAIFRNVGGVEI